MSVVEKKLRRLDLPLPGGRVLFIALEFDADGTATDLVLASGFAGGSGLRELSAGLCVPAAAIPGLRDALAAVQR